VTSYVRQVGGRTTSIVNKADRGCDRGRTISIATQLRQTLVNSPPVQPFLHTGNTFGDQYTDHVSCKICSNRPHLMHCMQVM